MCSSFGSLYLYTFAAILSMTSYIASADGGASMLLSNEDILCEEEEEDDDLELVLEEGDLMELNSKPNI